MALLSEIKNIIVDSDITFENVHLNNEININDFIIKKVEMVSNYKMKLYLENNSNDKGWSHITAINESVCGRNILTKLLLSPKIINVPLGVLPKLDIKFFET